MSLHIYNSLTRTKIPFEPIQPQQVRMYVCGPTVYDQPHIGHARSAYIFDIVRTYLEYRGYAVTFVRNVTDVDDKIIDKARSEFKGEDLNSSFQKVAAKYLLAYHEALQSLGIKTAAPQVIEPRASQYIGKMIAFIRGLIEKGAAYQAGSDVYFDITRAKGYGKLSGQSLQKMESGARVSPTENKKDPLDFALWKSAKPEEPSWESPWGRGRPGWHIECSVMSQDILGDEFDIHGGGLDLIFPHHENEIAQSEAGGNAFARIWMHHGLLTINAQKMSKSLGNFITIADVLRKFSVDDLKVFFLSAHYTSPIDFSWERLQETVRSLQRFEIFFRQAQKLRRESMTSVCTAEDFIEKNKSGFLNAMDDDFNTPEALASLFSLVKETNEFIEAHRNMNELAGIVNESERTILELGGKIFGIFSGSSAPLSLTKEEEGLLNQRREARAKKDFERSDELRELLRQKGIVVEDTKEGQIPRRAI